MFGFSLSHILVVLILALIVIGPKQLPEVARALGRMLTELRRASNMFTSQMNSQFEDRQDRANEPPPSGHHIEHHQEAYQEPLVPQDAVGEQLDLIDVTPKDDEKKS
jgi:sec-independent protein translocase protein TatB